MKNKATSNKRKTNTGTKAKTTSQCQSQILLRKVPCEVVQLINRKKAEILTNNPYRTTVSHSEAIYKLILKK